MPQSPGDVPPSPDSTRSGGLASVLKNLASAKLQRTSPPPALPPSLSLPSIDSLNATLGASTPSSALSPNHQDSFELLRNGTPSERITAAGSLRYAIAEYPLNPVLDIWYAAKNMIETHQPTRLRNAGWELLTECAKHTASTDLERNEYFQTLSAPANPEDFHLQLAALVDLTRGGRDLSGFDYEVLPLLKTWLFDTYRSVHAARKKASRVARAISRTRITASGEEKNLTQLFSFVIDVVKFSFNVANEKSVEGLIDTLLAICMNTSVEDDLRACIAVLDSIVTFGDIPPARLKECVQVLSSIYCLVPRLSKDSWHTLSILCRSHNGQATVRVLLGVLRNPPTDKPEKDLNREIRGSLAILQKLLTKTSEKGYPIVPFALLVNGLITAVQHTSSPKVYASTLSLVNLLFDCGDGKLHSSIVDEDWSLLLEVASECSRRAVALTTAPVTDAARDDNDKPDEVIGHELLRLVTRLEVLATQKSTDFIPRQTLVRFFSSVHRVLPDSAACTVLDYFQEFRCCSPSDPQWRENLKLVLDAFFADRTRSSQTRLRALNTLTDAYELLDLLDDGETGELVPDLVQRLISNIAEETDIPVLDEVVSLAVSIAVSADMDLFVNIVDTLRSVVVNDRLKSPIMTASSSSLPPPQTHAAGDPLSGEGQPLRSLDSQTASKVVTRGYVRLFIQLMDVSGPKCARLFTSLVNIARSNLCETDARLTAMKLLFSLRADWADRVFITGDNEAESLASGLHRTPSSLGRRQADDAAHAAARSSRGDLGAASRASRSISFGQVSAGSNHERGHPTRSVSAATAPTQPYHQMWSLPDADRLLEGVSSRVSSVLVSHAGEEAQLSASSSSTSLTCSSEDTESSEAQALAISGATTLNMSLWLEAVLHLLGNGCDWEIYSFVLVHLPPQLTNHAIFRSAIPQVLALRKLLCEQIRTHSFQEPPTSSRLRRADVAICLFHSLTILLSYHAYFQKGDEDEMVRTFVNGIATWERTAKGCIHALWICCHELPLPTSKALVQMLQKMTQIITQPQVAVHILEFLACLSRLQDLYVNFREDEYRIVFGICFRYLQYVRDKKKSNRASHAGESVASSAASTASTATTATAAASGDAPAPAPTQPSATDDVPQYVFALAYHVITFWFLALKLPDRAHQVGWIIKTLFADADGSHGTAVEEQALVTLDFLQRVTYADVDESGEDPHFTSERYGEIQKRRWLVGNSIITIEQATRSGWAQVTKRQPSGTSSYTIREAFWPPPLHQTRNPSEATRDGQYTGINVLPSHLLVQLMAPLPQGSDAQRPVPLPDDDAMDRAIRVFDRSSTVDGHKVGVIYIGEGQSQEGEILANVSGSSDYVEFLNGLGTLTRLRGAVFNTQGLDKENDFDGQYTYCWRDRVTEIVFHVTTQMPTDLERDPRCIHKKKHIGNDFVNIIFNDSGLPFGFETFPSDFNYVNIVITPESRASFIARREKGRDKAYNPFYRVQVMSRAGFPRISPASETKMISLRSLPGFIRLLALNASVFAHVWANREGGEHVGSWRSRLREIKRLRDRYGPKPAAAAAVAQATSTPHAGPPTTTTPSPPPSSLGHHPSIGGSLAGSGPGMTGAGAGQADGRPGSSVRDSFTSLRRSSVATFFTNTSEQNSHRTSMLSTWTGETEIGHQSGLDSLVDSADFSKWS